MFPAILSDAVQRPYKVFFKVIQLEQWPDQQVRKAFFFCFQHGWTNLYNPPSCVPSKSSAALIKRHPRPKDTRTRPDPLPRRGTRDKSVPKENKIFSLSPILVCRFIAHFFPFYLFLGKNLLIFSMWLPPWFFSDLWKQKVPHCCGSDLRQTRQAPRDEHWQVRSLLWMEATEWWNLNWDLQCVIPKKHSTAQLSGLFHSFLAKTRNGKSRRPWTWLSTHTKSAGKSWKIFQFILHGLQEKLCGDTTSVSSTPQGLTLFFSDSKLSLESGWWIAAFVSHVWRKYSYTGTVAPCFSPHQSFVDVYSLEITH